jgi:hypothetical protein
MAATEGSNKQLKGLNDNALDPDRLRNSFSKILSFNASDHLSSRDIVGNNEVDKSNGTDMIMGNLSNGDTSN